MRQEGNGLLTKVNCFKCPTCHQWLSLKSLSNDCHQGWSNTAYDLEIKHLIGKKSIVSSSSARAWFDDNRPWWWLWNARVNCNLNYDRNTYFLAFYFLKIDNSYKTCKVKLHTVRKSDKLTYFLTKQKTAQLLITWRDTNPWLVNAFLGRDMEASKVLGPQ